MINIEINYFEIIYAFFATFFFSIIFNLKGEKILYSSLCGSLGWLAYLSVLQLGYSKRVGFLVAAMVITAYSEIIAKKFKTIVTVTLIPGLIPLVPGSGIYYTMSNLVNGDFKNSLSVGLETLFLTVSICVGILIISTFSQIFYRTGKYLRIIKKYRHRRKKIKNFLD